MRYHNLPVSAHAASAVKSAASSGQASNRREDFIARACSPPPLLRMVLQNGARRRTSSRNSTKANFVRQRRTARTTQQSSKMIAARSSRPRFVSRCVSGNALPRPLANLPHDSCSCVWEQRARGFASMRSRQSPRLRIRCSESVPRPTARVARRARARADGASQRCSSAPYVPSPATDPMFDASRLLGPLQNQEHRAPSAELRASWSGRARHAIGRAPARRPGPNRVLTDRIGSQRKMRVTGKSRFESREPPTSIARFSSAIAAAGAPPRVAHRVAASLYDPGEKILTRTPRAFCWRALGHCVLIAGRRRALTHLA